MNLVSLIIFVPIPKPRKLLLKERKAKLIKGFKMAGLSKRQCKRYKGRALPYSISDYADRCLECVRLGTDYNLSPLNYSKLKRLQDRKE